MDEAETLDDHAISLLDLPWEQILSSHVLPYLTLPELFTLRSVSRTCLELVETHFGRQFHLNTCTLGDNCSQTAFSIMTRDSTCLKTLVLRGAKSWLTNEVFLPVVTDNPHLEKIDLTDCISLSGCSVYAIGANCPCLKHLSLRNCVWLSQENLIPFMSRQKAIEYLDFTGCWNLDDETIVTLVQSCSRHVFLAMTTYRYNDTSGVCLTHTVPEMLLTGALDPENMKTDFAYKLKQLLLSNIYGLTDRALCAVAHNCSDLRTLCIRGCWRVTDYSISMLSEYCPKLKMLQVKECRDITEKSLGSLRQRKVIIDKTAPPNAQLIRLEYLSNLHRIHPAI